MLLSDHFILMKWAIKVHVFALTNQMFVSLFHRRSTTVSLEIIN